MSLFHFVRMELKLYVLLTALATLGLSGCTMGAHSVSAEGPRTETMSWDQMGQTDFNRTVTIAMRDNLESLTHLLEKLYRRNPTQWKRGDFPDLETAISHGRAAIQQGQTPASLQGLSDVQILSAALDPGYSGDRVAAFVFGLADTIIQAHDGKTRFYATDVLDAQHVYNAARNVEAAAWLLATRENAAGQPLLLANEISDKGVNLSFEREFGELVGRLDLIANLLDENLRRVGVNYMQGLLFFNFLPVR